MADTADWVHCRRSKWIMWAMAGDHEDIGEGLTGDGGQPERMPGGPFGSWADRYSAPTSGARAGGGTKPPRWVLRFSLYMQYLLYVGGPVLIGAASVLLLVRRRWVGAVVFLLAFAWTVVRGWMALHGRWTYT